MPEVTRDIFADMCFCSRNAINTYVGRKKINVLETGLIDTSDELNKVFKQKRKKLHEKKELLRNASLLPDTKENKKDNIPSEKPQKQKQSAEDKKEDLFINSLTYRKEIADTQKAERDNELKKLTLEKMAGKLLPIDLMRGILKINIQSIFVEFENELMNLASIYCDVMAAGDRSKLSEVIDLMRQNLHRIILQTKENSSKEIKAAINEYSETRNRGERK